MSSRPSGSRASGRPWRAIRGDAVTDIEATRAAGVAVITYANKPSKREPFERLEPDAITDRMSDLAPVNDSDSAP